jgi:hypothetical protein
MRAVLTITKALLGGLLLLRCDRNGENCSGADAQELKKHEIA